MLAYEGNQPFIFISYSHTDRERVLPIIESLADKGFRIWYDDGVNAGARWADDIADHIAASRFVLAFISHRWTKSGFCRKELTFAVECEKGLIPIYLDEGVEETRGVRMLVGEYQALYFYRFSSFQELVDKLTDEPLLQVCRLSDGEPSDEGKAHAGENNKVAVTSDANTAYSSADAAPPVMAHTPNTAKTAPVTAPPVVTAPRPVNDLADFDIRGGVLVKYKGKGGVVTLPDGITAIAKYAFAKTPVTDVLLPASIGLIGFRAFSGCSYLKRVTVTTGVPIRIEANAFEDCVSMTNVINAATVVEVGDFAFARCAALDVINLSGAVSIGRLCFEGCHALRGVKVSVSVSLGYKAIPEKTKLVH